ncbi:Lar family restriction alleviation protein [Dechloromonas denitrificans]|uniref:Lar family restriction alleviation protein n=1 Tax=Dechloromonas denitrificans TaxID=281362 RepID=UPI001CF86C27|nr:Lar family restriction alleviation protein [Dechloromonas denitrificans]
MIRLKSCPFCGGEAELDSNQSFREFVSGKISREVAVYCRHCSAEISVCVPDVPDITPEQVADMWNTRAEGGAA